MRVLETRDRDGMRWRRYRDEHGVTHTTLEAPEAVVRLLGPTKLRLALERAERTAARRRRNAAAIALLESGWKPIAVAAKVGLCESQVRRLRQQAAVSRRKLRSPGQ